VARAVRMRGEHSNRRHGRSGNVAGVYGVPLSL
jgi:hypothetical protein